VTLRDLPRRVGDAERALETEGAVVVGIEEAGSASHQRLQCTTSWKGRRSGLTSGRSGRSTG
jgi:hypothetical protein